VRVQDVFAAIPQMVRAGQRYDLILADPPYGEKNGIRRSTSFAQRLLDLTTLPELLAPGGWLILGHAKRDTLDVPPHWREHKCLKHGDSYMRFLAATVSGPIPSPDPPAPGESPPGDSQNPAP
jgi:16S rRNA G966 N2-methylase RsmD